MLVSVGLCPDGAEFGGAEDEPVELFFTVISPANDPAAHLQSLALISRWIKDNQHVETLVGLSDPERIFEHIRGSHEPAGAEAE